MSRQTTIINNPMNNVIAAVPISPKSASKKAKLTPASSEITVPGTEPLSTSENANSEQSVTYTEGTKWTTPSATESTPPIGGKEKIISYEGAQVWQTTIRDTDEDLFSTLTDTEDISIWRLYDKTIEFLVREEKKLKVHQLLKSKGLNHTVLVLNVQRRIDATKVENVTWTHSALRIGHRMNWNSYPTMTIIDEYFIHLAENYQSICKVEIIGKSTENRPLKMVTISNGNPNNKAILITAGQHSREWVAISSAFYVINHIVTKYDKEPNYVRNIDWYIIPLMNPDGFLHTHTYDRLWRKNRRAGRCRGVDLNRNFETHWGLLGVSHNECKETYAGPSPFSEPETRAIRDLVNGLSKKPSAYLDIHCFGQIILYPWSALKHPTKDDKLLSSTALAMMASIFRTSRVGYRYGTVYKLMNPTTGAAIDWCYASGIRLSFAIETRDSGYHGFFLPNNQIEPAGRDILSAVKQVATLLWPKDKVNKTNRGDTWF